MNGRDYHQLHGINAPSTSNLVRITYDGAPYLNSPRPNISPRPNYQNKDPNGHIYLAPNERKTFLAGDVSIPIDPYAPINIITKANATNELNNMWQPWADMVGATSTNKTDLIDLLLQLKRSSEI